MSNPEEPTILTDEDGHALAIVSGGELHPVEQRRLRTPSGEHRVPWRAMSEAELLLAKSELGRTVALYAYRATQGDEVGNLLARADDELTEIEDELIRRGFAHPGFARDLRRPSGS